ncbi:MAG: hypothetical protein M3Q29_14170 [Chloroflexota bacterium]|nr:hypothetical protein [Chloroflexota bacterium]
MNLDGQHAAEDGLREALRSVSPREATKIMLDPVRYLRMSHDAHLGAETDLSPAAVRYLTLLMQYIETHGTEGVRDLASRWRQERDRR